MTAYRFTFQIIDENDASNIREVETRTSGFSEEVDLMASLLEDESAHPMLSLLVRHEDEAVGYILPTRVTFRGEMDSPLIHILAPLIVMPEYQGTGVGGRLIRTGIEHLRLMSCQTVSVLGYATYYPQHGFEPCAGNKGRPAPYPVPKEHKVYWMIRALTAQSMNVASHIQCTQTLMRPEHRRE